MTPLQLDLTSLLLALSRVLLGVVLLVLARLLKPVLSPYRTERELTAHDNPAYGFALAGYYLGTAIVFLGIATAQPLPLDAGTAGALQALALDLAWTLGGVFALSLSRWLLDRTLVARCCQSDEIIRNRNVAAGVVEFGIYVASALVLAGALREPGGTLWTTLAFFVLSQAVLLLFARLYQRLAGYDVAREIQGANVAAGTALSLTLVALSLLLLKATSGEFVDWPTNLSYFAFDAVVGFALLLALRWVTDWALLPNAQIAEEIVRDRNLNVGLLEGTVAVAIGGIILMVF